MKDESERICLIHPSAFRLPPSEVVSGDRISFGFSSLRPPVPLIAAGLRSSQGKMPKSAV
jgi:hypothetical protein